MIQQDHNLFLLLSDVASMLPVAARLHPDDLQKLQTRVLQAFTALEPPTQQKRRVSLTFDAYNSRRYSKPWIAVVTAWPVGGKPTLEFGNYIGSDDGGAVEIMASPGQIVRVGRRDNRGSNDINNWYVVTDEWTLEPVTQVQARELFK